MARPKKKLTEIEELQAIGLSKEQIQEVILGRARGGAPGAFTPVDGAPSVLPANVRQDRVTLGPDPEVVRRQQEAARNAPPPPEPEILTLELEPRWMEIVILFRDILRGQRQEPDLTANKALTLLIRWASVNHPDIVQVRSAGKGKMTFQHPDQKVRQ